MTPPDAGRNDHTEPAGNALLAAQDIVQLPAAPADRRIAYGADPLQFGELRLPKGGAAAPVIVVIHGGCWTSRFASLRIMDAASDALTRLGVATWNVEYRCVDQPGGGWPGTFLDIGRAVDHVRQLARDFSLDPQRVVVLGHSAGGHLAFWAAARHCLPASSDVASLNPLHVLGAINLGGPSDLRSFSTVQEGVCYGNPVTQLVGGTPEQCPQRFREASPIEMLPSGVRHISISGRQDEAVPPVYGLDYASVARQQGDDASHITLEDTGHFEVIAPKAPAWTHVEHAVKSILGMHG